MLSQAIKQIILRAAILSLFSIGCAFSAPMTEAYQPTLAQEGKDVIWIPTPTDLAERLLKAAQVTSKDLVYDLGAGDGKIAILAAKQFKASAVGVEYNPDMAEFARKNVLRAGVSNKVKIITGEIFKEDFSAATVVTLYLLPALNIRLRPTLLAMQPGTRIVSNTFTMGLWTADQTILGDNGNIGYLWIVPANIEGDWSMTGLPKLDASAVQLTIKQQFQSFTGSLNVRGNHTSQPIMGQLKGPNITFDYRDTSGALRTVIATFEQGELRGFLKDQPNVFITGKKTS